MPNESPAVYLGLGSNLGDRAANLREALRRLSPLARPEEVSSLYETAPVGEEEQPTFYNAVCRIVTALEPAALLRHLKDIEFAIGRRPGPRWGPRPIDLDILLYGDRVLEQEDLLIPHPLLTAASCVLTTPYILLLPETTHSCIISRHAIHFELWTQYLQQAAS